MKRRALLALRIILLGISLTFGVTAKSQTVGELLGGQPLCFFTIHFKWTNGVSHGERGLIFRNTLIKIGLMTHGENTGFLRVDYFKYNHFTIATVGKCTQNRDDMRERIEYAIEHSKGPFGISEAISKFSFEIKESTKDSAMSRLEQFSYKNSLIENFRLLNEAKDPSECAVRLSFPTPDSASYLFPEYEVGGDAVYTANYLAFGMHFFSFPVIMSGAYSQYGKRVPDAESYNYYYIIYYAHCDKKLEMTNVLINWSQALVGIPFRVEGLEISGSVSKEEIKKAFGNL